MKCAVHPELDAVGYCRNCGKALCPGCSREVRGMIYCESCLADMVTQPRVVHQGGGNTAMATFLGFIPGLGAVYNGEYMKAIVHVLIFASFIGIFNGDHPDSIMAVSGVLFAAFIFYMAIDANRVAKARLAGTQPTDILGGTSSGKNIWPFILIAVGVLYLMKNFGVINLDRLIDVWWPMLLIAAGAGIAWRRMDSQR